MDVFLILSSIFILAYIAVRQILKNVSGQIPPEESAKYLPFVLFSASFVLLSNLCAGESAISRVPYSLSLALSPLYCMTSSFLPQKWVRSMVFSSVSVSVLSVILSLVEALSPKPFLQPVFFRYAAMTVCCITSMVVLSAFSLRLLDIGWVMRAGSVWSMTCLYVDGFYIIMILLATGAASAINVYVNLLFMMSLILALCVRIKKSSIFVIMESHERRIVESMKVSSMQTVSDITGTDQLYVNIYERVVRYFDLHRPYLNNDLTINDIVDVVYTNKLYISKAINHCTGRNFCQFVNYYRVTYAVELFRSDPQLKVVDMANRCGFNSATSFSAAFRLYMGDNPGDWCRKERARIINN